MKLLPSPRPYPVPGHFCPSCNIAYLGNARTRYLESDEGRFVLAGGWKVRLKPFARLVPSINRTLSKTMEPRPPSFTLGWRPLNLIDAFDFLGTICAHHAATV